MIGCLPVFFLRGDTGSFSVDRDKQAPVTAKLKRHFEEEGGILSFCPEVLCLSLLPSILSFFLPLSLSLSLFLFLFLSLCSP